jgi:hypothetical protein
MPPGVGGNSFGWVGHRIVGPHRIVGAEEDKDYDVTPPPHYAMTLPLPRRKQDTGESKKVGAGKRAHSF